jgi:hypothetical protein
MKPHSLLETLQAIIQRSYGMPPVIDDIGSFVVGDAGLRALYPAAGDPESGGAGARVLVRDAGATLRAALYYPDALVRHLERFNPLAGIGDVNIEAFAVFVEELDHLLVLASRAAEGRSVSLLELEHHAGVTKYLVVLHFLGKHARRRRIPESLRRWARHHLFERYAAGGEGGRYREAAHLARKYVDHLEGLPVGARHEELRTFQRRPFSETLRIVTSWN